MSCDFDAELMPGLWGLRSLELDCGGIFIS